MKKLGFLVSELSHEHMSYALVKNMNELVKEKVPVYVFYRNLAEQIESPHFSIFQDVAAYNFNGLLVATDFKAAQRMSNCVGNCDMLYYVWGLEWLYKNYNYNELSTIFLNPKIKLASRSYQYCNIIKQTWNRQAIVIEDFNHNEFLKLIKLIT